MPPWHLWFVSPTEPFPDLQDFVLHAPVGDVLVYHIGNLAYDRADWSTLAPVKDHTPWALSQGARREPLATLADRVYALAHDHKVLELSQHRVSPGVCEYRARKKRNRE